MTENILRTSERNLFKRCQWQWERSYVDRLAPKRQESVALWFGTGIHLALEHYYIPGTKRGTNPVETWNKYVDESTADTRYINTEHNGDSTFAVEARELGAAMLQSYVEEYGDEEWMDVLATELDFQVGVKHKSFYPLTRGVGVDMENYVTKTTDKTAYVGSIDLVYRDTRDGKVYLADHKTARALGSSNTQYLPLDDQAGTYYAVAITVLRDKGLIGPKERIHGIVYNYLVKAMPDTRPVNADGYATNKPKKEHYVTQLAEHGISTQKVNYAAPKRSDYLAALEKAGIEFPKSAKMADLASLCEQHDVHVETAKTVKDMTVSEMEAEAEKAGITVYGDVSSSQPPKRFERKIVRKNPQQQNRQIRRMSEDLTAMSLVRNGVVPATKTPTRECSFCPFVDICEIDEKGMDYSELARDLFTTWDPYATHRKALQ